MPRLLVDISAHGFGHLGQTAPVLNVLYRALPELEVTVRSGLPRERLALRIEIPFIHVAEATDFGYVMRDAVAVDLAASAARYRVFHAGWRDRVATEAAWLRAQRFDSVLANAAYLPLAGAAQAGIPAAGMCSLNWADLFAHYFGAEPWAQAIHGEILAAYRSARVFLRATPGMEMAALGNVRPVGALCRTAVPDRPNLAARLGVGTGERWALVAMGGIGFPLDFARWPRCDGRRWLVPAGAWRPRADMTPFDGLATDFTALLASVDAVVTKPGYGTFVEAACHGVPVLYLPRGDWPEETCLTEWLHAHGRAQAIGRVELERGDLGAALDALWAQVPPAVPRPDGVGEAAAILAALFG